MMHTNQLIHASSPYLLQHAHNTVSWFPWGEAAFEKARQEGKPVFLSIGYSTCHWCHVMAHESFEDEQVAEELNRSFVSIKVDREERPDVDGVYMRACQALTGAGGWPTSVFLTPEGKPFFAGTYYPKEAFLKLIDAVANAWQQDRAALLEDSARFADAIQERVTSPMQEEAPINEAVLSFQRSFDREYGGFGSAPKFPSPHNLMFLLRTAPALAENTLDCMYRGGMFDHIGGGFSRYSTDRLWLVPHFEKMLYDNALLAMAYLLGYEERGNPLYQTVAERIFQYLERDMQDKEGGFFSAQDADSEGVEGKFYLFTPKELRALLGEEEGKRFCDYYGMTEKGNFDGKNIPNLLHQPEEDPSIATLTAKVYAYRKGRIPPHTDRKKLAAWNALTAAAYAMAGRILGNEAYTNIAKETIAFIERDLMKGDTIFVSITGEKRSGPGFLDDYAFYLFALFQLHQTSQEPWYLTRALHLARRTCELFWDEEEGGFFFSGAENESLISRPKESWDGAMPSGNSVMAFSLSRLALLSEEPWLIERAAQQARFMNGMASTYPMGYGFYLWSALPVKKIVCTPELPPGFRLRSHWAFQLTHSPDYPVLNGKPTFYLCEGQRCHPPTNELP